MRIFCGLALSGLLASTCFAAAAPSPVAPERTGPPWVAAASSSSASTLGEAAEGSGGGSGDGPDLNDRGWKSGDTATGTPQGNDGSAADKAPAQDVDKAEQDD